MKFAAFAFLAGLASAFGFEPTGLWPVTLLAIAVLLELTRRAETLRSALLRGWAFGVGHFVLGLNWIATAFTYQAAMPAWLGWVAVLLLSLYLAIYPALAAGLAWRWGRRMAAGFVLIFGAGWIVTEWMRSELFTGFAWNPLGAALLPAGLAFPARWIGTYGLSGLAILLAGILFLVARAPTRKAGGAVAAGALIVCGIAFWTAPRPGEEAGPLVRIVQPNIGQDVKWTPGFAARNLARLTELSIAGPPPAEPRLLIWPEAAVTEPLQDERSRVRAYRLEAALTRAAVGRAIRDGDLLLTGGITVQSEDGFRASSGTNSVFAIGAGGRILARYDKAHLVPYGEYLPMRPILSALGLSRLAPGSLDFEPGPGARTLPLPLAGQVGFQLCYEIIFSGEVVDPAHRPDFIFNPSNDAWFGAWGPPQHLAQARLRALEEGLPVVRATPTGISAIIDARGRLLHRLPMHQAGVIDARLPAPAAQTLFARFGNLLPWAFALLLAVTGYAFGRREEAIAAGAERR